MKTTLIIPDPVMKRVREEAARRGTTISAVVEEALRGLLDRGHADGEELPPLPCFDAGRALVDISSREALYRLDPME